MWRTSVAVLFAACVPVSQPSEGPVPSSLMREHDLLAPVWIQTGKPDSEIGGGVSGGDVNGDGYNDLVVGNNDVSDEDWLLVFHGSSTGLDHHPASSFDIAGKLGSFNHSKFAGDVNADGFDDVIVSDPFHPLSARHDSVGNAHLFYGTASGLDEAAVEIGIGQRAYSNFGSALDGVRDVNGDGFDDVMIGGTDSTAFLYTGSVDGLGQAPAWTFSLDEHDQTVSLAAAGDVNGDGFDDVILGAQHYGGAPGLGLAFHGSADGLGDKPDWIRFGDPDGFDFGETVASAGDVNGDGFDDVLLTGQGDDTSCCVGRARVELYEGSPTGLGSEPSWVSTRIVGGGSLSLALTAAGDVNADGFGDIVIGNANWDGKAENVGSVSIVFGPMTKESTSVVFAVGPHEQRGASTMWFGVTVALAGDTDGDGLSEIVVGAPGYDSEGGTDAGLAVLFSPAP